MLYKRLLKLTSITFILLLSSASIVLSYEKINNVPESVPYFVGRSDILKEMQDILFREKQLSLVGIAGVGKTEVLRKFVQANKYNFKVIWSIDSDNDIRYQLQDLARTINYTVGSKKLVSEDIDAVLNSVINFLNNYGKFLLVFENFKPNNQNQIYNAVKSNSNGYIIVLSRTKDNLSNIIEVVSFNDEESETLFEVLYPDIDVKLKEEIRGKFKGYPLGLVKSLHFLRQYKYLDFNEYKNIKHNNKFYLDSMMLEILNKSSEVEKKLFIISSLINNHDIDTNFMKTAGIKGHELLLLNNKMLLTKIKDIKNYQHLDDKYEMHDLVKETLHSIINTKEIKENIIELSDKITKIFPYSYAKLSELQKNVPSLLSHLETINKHTEEYNIPIESRIGIQSLRLITYLINKDYENGHYLHEWFKANFPIDNLNTKVLNIYQSKALAYTLGAQGEYEDFYFNNYKEAFKYFYKMEDIVTSQDALVDDIELKFELYGHIAQTFLYIGNLEKAKEYLDKINIYALQDKSGVDLGFCWFLKAKIAEQNRLFKEASKYIDKSIEVLNITIGFNLFTAPAYLLKADICLSERRYKEAYELSKKVYELSKELDNQNEFKAETLIKLARSELILNNSEYKKNAYKAFEILSSIPSNVNKDIKELMDDNLAEVYVLLGDIKHKEGDVDQALENYMNSLTIFKNRYGEHLKNHNVSEVLERITRLFIKEQRYGEALFLVDEYAKIFGANTKEVIEFYNIIEKSSNKF